MNIDQQKFEQIVNELRATFVNPLLPVGMISTGIGKVGKVYFELRAMTYSTAKEEGCTNIRKQDRCIFD